MAMMVMMKQKKEEKKQTKEEDEEDEEKSTCYFTDKYLIASVYSFMHSQTRAVYENM